MVRRKRGSLGAEIARDLVWLGKRFCVAEVDVCLTPNFAKNIEAV